MVAVQDIVGELQAETAEALALDGREEQAKRFDVKAWLRDMPLAKKIRTLFALFLSVIVAMALVLGFGLSDVYGRYMAAADVQRATLASADLRSTTGEMRFYAVRFIFGGETSSIDKWREAHALAESELDGIETVVKTQVPALAPGVAEMKGDLRSYETKFDELRTSLEREGQGPRSTALAYELSEIGDAIVADVATLESDLVAQGVEMERSGMANFFNMISLIIVLTILAGLVLALGLRYLSRDFVGKIGEITDGMIRLTKGDRHFEIEGEDRKDEIGEMLRAIALFKRANIRLEKWAKERAERAEAEMREHEERERERDELRRREASMLADVADRFEKQVGEIVGGVAAASTQLQTTASSMASAADQSTSQATKVVESMNEASSGVTAAAAASDEFAMSIGEISRQAASSAELARKASESAEKADTAISALSDSAVQVGDIVELIQSIAKRTNLLALNASIEAARGGEAGRGFAVVASEVKELAAQTSRATEEVAAQIRGMQQSTGNSVEVLRTIGEQIEQLEATAISIASAVDQQSVAGQDLARSIDLAARSSDEVSARIVEVRETALSTGAAAAQVLSSATELEGQAANMRSQVRDFIARVKQG
ncbi:methyl-accepting chemotaxis protein [Erythrobacter sp. HKB08]|uniref:methyl-accepting chemotaxis protein n=1 Tax=Erythrobacter sp. HKB08 TaxID=2502843 RepID=UPI001F326C5E|nr:methyl-accepting chemotaxis protein [Erythrobacter sp. HKB08]